MSSLLLASLLLLLPADLPEAGTPRLVCAVDLDAEALLGDPALLAGDTMALRVQCGREAYFKLSERGEVLAAGKLLPGSNPLRFARPGLVSKDQSLLFLLDLLAGGRPSQRTIRIKVTVGGGTETGAAPGKALSGNFTLGMYHADRLIGFRKKSMSELLKLTTGPVVPVEDPALAGSAIRSQPPSQSISIIGLGMALAKYLAGKKAEKMLKAHTAELQKKKLELSIPRLGANGEKREVPVVIELKSD
jgi:hypothetical protein